MPKSIQDNLNTKKTSTLLSLQAVSNGLANTTGLSTQQALQIYCSSTGSIQDCLNKKAGTSRLSIQDASALI